VSHTITTQKLGLGTKLYGNSFNLMGSRFNNRTSASSALSSYPTTSPLETMNIVGEGN